MVDDLIELLTNKNNSEYLNNIKDINLAIAHKVISIQKEMLRVEQELDTIYKCISDIIDIDKQKLKTYLKMSGIQNINYAVESLNYHLVHLELNYKLDDRPVENLSDTILTDSLFFKFRESYTEFIGSVEYLINTHNSILTSVSLDSIDDLVHLKKLFEYPYDAIKEKCALLKNISKG